VIRLYRYGVAALVGLEAANYTAWGANMIDWRCVVAAVLGGAFVLLVTASALRAR